MNNKLMLTGNVYIVLKGFPERVQEVADALDRALPEAFEWHDFAAIRGRTGIVLKGFSLDHRNVAVSTVADLATFTQF